MGEFSFSGQKDSVYCPERYRGSGVECIDAIKSMLGPEFSAYCAGNVAKYVWRHDAKGGVFDLLKALDYLIWMIEQDALEEALDETSAELKRMKDSVSSFSVALNCAYDSINCFGNEDRAREAYEEPWDGEPFSDDTFQDEQDHSADTWQASQRTERRYRRKCERPSRSVKRIY